MPIRTGRELHVRSEDAFSLVELLVAAMILVTAVIGIFTALEAAGRAGSEERHRGIAYQLAQQDQARLRAIKVTSLLGLNQTRSVTIDGITYSVKSTSKITTDATGTESCATGTASADYLNITSTITWPTMGPKSPVVIQSIVTPPSGSFDADAGALAVSVQNGQGVGVPNVPLTGSGAGSFSGSTGDTGCAVFANLREGTYTVTPTATGLVDQDGKAPAGVPASVVAQATNTKVLQLDRPGSIAVTFQTKGATGSIQPSMADELMVFNTGMTTAKNFGTAGTRLAKITASPLFPFSSPDSVYAGTCTNNNPPPTSPLSATASVPVNAGGPVSNALITLPAMDITVRSGTSSSSSGLPVNNAKVVITDKGCSPNVKRTFFTNSSGKLPDPGLPYSTYDLCVSGQVNGTGKLVTRTGIVVKNANTPTVVPTIYLGGGTTNSTGCT